MMTKGRMEGTISRTIIVLSYAQSMGVASFGL